MDNKKIPIKKLVSISVIFLLIVIGLIFGWSRIFAFVGIYADRNSGCAVSFIDVGKGDCELISCDGYNILIDAGPDITAENIKAYLKRYNVDTLDLVIATHPDKDHIGGMAEILSEFNVKLFWQKTVDKSILPDTDCYNNMLMMLDEKNVKTAEPNVNNRVIYGNMCFTVLSPDKEYYTTNNDSIVVRLECFGKSFLFMGDAEKEVEKELITNDCNLESDVLKVSHHGSKGASTYDFLQSVNPKYAVICVGENTNNLPSNAVLKRLDEDNVNVLRTDMDSTVTISVDNSGTLKSFKES